MLFFNKRKKKPTINDLRNSLKLKIFTNKENDWAKDDHFLFRAIDQLIDCFQIKHLKKFLHKKEIVLVKTNGQYSCALSYPKDIDLILIFPELHKLLRCVTPDLGIAILAHEFGHLYHSHSDQQIPRLKAQIQADHFAYELGYGYDLQEVLLNYSNLESQTRISYLTSLFYSDQ